MTPRTKQLSLIALALFLGVVVGAAVASRLLNPHIPSRWFTLKQPASEAVVPAGNSVDVGAHVSVSYSSAMVVDSDIPALEVTAVTGKAKFLPHASKDIHSVIGYVVTTSSNPIDKQKLPDKYKKERTINTKGGPLTVLPLEQPVYEVYFVLQLLDRDGFVLLSVNSPKHSLQSGDKSHMTQGQTPPVVPSGIAAITDSITIHLVIEKCLSARDE